MMAYKIIELEQGSEPWLAYRRFHIGASDSPIVLNESPWKTPYQLYQEKIEDTVTECTAAMRKGHELEPFVRGYANVYFKETFTPMVCESIAHPWMSASLDGMSEDKTCIIEIKYSTQQNHRDVRDNGAIPHHYWIQIQHQLAVTGLNLCYYCSYNGGEVVYTKILRDEGFIENLIRETKEFYKRIINLDPPELVDRDYIIVEDVAMISKADLYQRKKMAIKNLEIDLEQIRDELTSVWEHPHIKVGNLKLTRYHCKGQIDYKKIPELANIDLEKYRKTGKTSWRITET